MNAPDWSRYARVVERKRLGSSFREIAKGMGLSHHRIFQLYIRGLQAIVHGTALEDLAPLTLKERAYVNKHPSWFAINAPIPARLLDERGRILTNWPRYELALKERRSGKTFREIGLIFGVTANRAHQMCAKMEWAEKKRGL